jgi:hypothetical protein
MVGSGMEVEARGSHKSFGTLLFTFSFVFLIYDVCLRELWKWKIHKSKQADTIFHPLVERTCLHLMVSDTGEDLVPLSGRRFSVSFRFLLHVPGMLVIHCSQLGIHGILVTYYCITSHHKSSRSKQQTLQSPPWLRSGIKCDLAGGSGSGWD